MSIASNFLQNRLFDTQIQILITYLPPQDFVRASKVCMLWRELCHDLVLPIKLMKKYGDTTIDTFSMSVITNLLSWIELDLALSLPIETLIACKEPQDRRKNGVFNKIKQMRIAS